MRVRAKGRAANPTAPSRGAPQAGGQRIGAIVPGVLQQAERRHRALLTIQRRWPRLVGKGLAAHTKPVSLHRGRLIIHVDHPGEGFALKYVRPQVLERLQATTRGRIEELVIRAGEVSW